MTSMKVQIRFSDYLRSQRRSATRCLIATAATRQWGGSWNVTHGAAQRVSGPGEAMQWRPSLGAHLVMWAFDHRMPVPVRNVRLVRGRAVRPRSRKPRQPSSPASPARSPRARKAARVTALGALAAAVMLSADGLAWVMYVIAGAVLAVVALVTSLKVRRDRRAGIAAPVPHPPRQRTPGLTSVPEPQRVPAPSFALPPKPAPDLAPVQPAAPKAAPVVREVLPVPGVSAPLEHGANRR